MRPFKTLDEQINILMDRGLQINDYDNVKTYLIQNNYYNVVNMYSKLFQEKEISTFQEQHSMRLKPYISLIQKSKIY
ncbi:hypothetical protein V2W23_11990 [Staphylococcus gallinarum]|uniref:hypothetical protein n=1 Tax=Staphylococcus gallinarum TaxID=1293 RepID=UPI001E64D229|nr:hypothetical protein [Staphylococcus gallinarum]MCD8871420.1 hypothetical protein [Staphylococcus gallinarum]MCW0986343.1 hypothetical protein [Staphylococcus gallinarum]